MEKSSKVEDHSVLMTSDVDSHIFIATECSSQLLPYFQTAAIKQIGQPGVCVKTLALESSTVKDTQSIKGYFLHLFRRHGLHKNEREMVLNIDDQLIAVQLCLAARNKQLIGCFETEASQVLQNNKALITHKLQSNTLPNTQASQDVDFPNFLEEYSKFLRSNNVIDWMDVCMRVKEEVFRNEQLAKDLAQNFLVLGNPSSQLENFLLRVLAEGHHTHQVQAEVPLDQSFTDLESDTVPNVDVSIVKGELPHIQSPGVSHSNNITSVTEAFVERVLLDYLHLLVNSRNEIALSRVINIPNRGLSHSAFTHLKHESDKKGMSMYQTAVSYIMRLRLGGKSYAPDPNSKLAKYVKGLSEFTDLMQKLHTILEEDLDVRSAIRRTVTILKNNILKSQETLIRPQSVTAVTEKLQNQVTQVINQVESAIKDSPHRSDSAGGSMVGRKSLQVLRCVLDSWSLQSSSRCMDILSDAFSSQATPVRFPSLLSKFTSPQEFSPDELEKQPLAERMKHKQRHSKKVGAIPRYQANHDWAVVHADTEKVPSVIEDFIPSKSLVHPGKNKNFNEDKDSWNRPLARRVLESLNDQENAPTTSSQNTKLYNDDIVTAQHGKKSLKRPLSAVITNIDASQQPAAKKKFAKKTTSKKALPLQKGQKQLTAFFRV